MAAASSPLAVARIVWVCAVASGRVCDRVAREKSSKRNRSVTVRQTRRAARSRRARRSTSPTRTASRAFHDLGERPRARWAPDRASAAASAHPPGIAVVGERVEVAARRLAQDRDERRLGEPRHLADGRQPPFLQLPGGDRAHAPQPLHRERVEKVELAAGRHHQQPVGLGHSARHLGEELGAGHPDRDRQADALADLAPQPRGDLGRPSPRSARARERRGTPRRSRAPRPAASSARRPRTPPCLPRRTPTSAAARPPPAGTAGGPAHHPSPSGRRTPWPRSWPQARPRPRRSPGDRGGEDRLAARPRHRTRPGRRAGLRPCATRTHVRIRS